MSLSDGVEIKELCNNRVASIRFRFPERGTLSTRRIDTLITAAEDVVANSSARCIVFSSGIDGYFSDGFSLSEMFSQNASSRFSRQDFSEYEGVVDLYRRLIRIPLPTFSYVNGVCRGAGFEWALSTDFIVAGPRCEFALHEVRLGIVPGLGGKEMLSQRTRGKGLAYLLLSGETIRIHKAAEMGVVDSFAEGLHDAMERFIAPIAQRTRSSLVRMKSFLGLKEFKLAALGNSRGPFIHALSDYLIKHKRNRNGKGEHHVTHHGRMDHGFGYGR
jgi:enoyl-CoA hydratase/carnithine racemase